MIRLEPYSMYMWTSESWQNPADLLCSNNQSEQRSVLLLLTGLRKVVGSRAAYPMLGLPQALAVEPVPKRTPAVHNFVLVQ